jgi:hypothetical protein
MTIGAFPAADDADLLGAAGLAGVCRAARPATVNAAAAQNAVAPTAVERLTIRIANEFLMLASLSTEQV